MHITFGMHFPSSVNEGMSVLCRIDGIHHNRVIAGSGIFHSHGNGNTGSHQSVLLIFHASCTDRYITEHIIQILVILRI